MDSKQVNKLLKQIFLKSAGLALGTFVIMGGSLWLLPKYETSVGFSIHLSICLILMLYAAIKVVGLLRTLMVVKEIMDGVDKTAFINEQIREEE